MLRQRRSDGQMLRRFVGDQVSTLSEYEIEVTICTSTSDALDGDVWDMAGVDLSRFLAHPIVLWDHDMSQPIARASDLKVTPEKITARVTFPEEGVSPKADEIRKLVKAGIVTGVSSGILPVEEKPLDQRNPRGGSRITESILLEFSIVAVPSDAKSGVTARSKGGNTVPKPAPINTGENPDGSSATMLENTPQTRTAPQVSTRRGGQAVTFKRGLYQVAQLAYLFAELDWQVDIAKWEAAAEEDASKVPAMLAAVLQDLGDVLLAMTAEEIAEALADHDIEPEVDEADDDLDLEERNAIAAAPTPALRAFRRGLAHAKARAGKKLSADTVRCLREAKAVHEEAIAEQRSATAKHRKAVGMIEDLLDGATDESEEAAETDDTTEEETAERSRRARALQLKAKAFAQAD